MSQNENERSDAFSPKPQGLEKFRFIFLNLLQTRTCAREYRLIEAQSKAYFTIKILNRADPRQVKKEIAVLAELRCCPNIIRMFGALAGGNSPFQCIVYEYFESVKWEDINDSLTKEDIETYTYQVFLALNACHSRQIIHGCVNPSNLLIDRKKRQLKLTGWESAIMHGDPNSRRKDCNPHYYRSPELLLDFEGYDYAIDIWATGCIVAGSLFRKVHIFDGATVSDQLVKIVQILGWRGLSAYAQDSKISKIREFEAELQEIDGTGFEKFNSNGCTNVITREAIELIEHLLMYDHKKRFSAADALKHPYFASTNDAYGTATEKLVQQQSFEQLSAKLGMLPSFFSQNGYPEYVIRKIVGEGAHSRVYCVKDKNSGLKFAVKSLKNANPFQLKHEATILNSLRGIPSINRFLGSVMGAICGVGLLVFEYVENTQWKDIYNTLRNEDIQLYVYQIVLALEACHSRGIMHRDVKPSNLLINHAKRQLYLTDWGQAEFYNEGQSYCTEVGTLCYCSPELLLKYEKYDYSVDMWPIGCILASAIFRIRHMFNGDSTEDQLRQIVRTLGVKDFKDYCEKYLIDAECKELMDLDVHHRTEWVEFVSEVNQEVATAEAIDLVNRLLVFDHELRPSAKMVMQHDYFRKMSRSNPKNL